MKIIIFGGTGFIGKKLVQKLQAEKHEVLVQDIRRDKDWRKKLETAEAVINLAGFPIFGKRWSTKVKALIHDSRVNGTREIVAEMGKLVKAGNSSIKVFVSASAIGYYGNSESKKFTEESREGSDFLAFVCKAWEDEAQRAEREFSIRTVIPRIGIVLGKGGGALEKILPPFKLFAGGPIGNGKQAFSWVHIDDVIGIIQHALKNDSVRGAVNACSPNPLNNKDFSKCLGKVLGRPSWAPVPKPALYALVGGAAEILVNGQWVYPEKTLSSGYAFQFDELEKALTDVLRE